MMTRMKKISGDIKEEKPVEDENMKYIRKRMEEFDLKVKKMKKESRYEQFVKSYSHAFNNQRLFNNFDQITSNKKTLQVLLDFREFKFTIIKNYTDSSTEDYLIYDQQSFNIEYFIDDKGNMSVTLTIKNIGLFDKDKEEVNKLVYDADDDEDEKNKWRYKRRKTSRR